MDAATATAEKIYIRHFVRADTPSLLAIERESFDNPWRESDFRLVMSQRNCIGMAAECQNKIVGYFAYEHLHGKKIRLLNIAVSPIMRRGGIGRLMIDKLKEKLGVSVKKLIAEVRESNLAAQIFLRSCGFRAVNVLVDYWEDTDEDAYLFLYRESECGGT